MVEQQIRTWEVLDQRVLDLVSSIPREKFVPDGFARLAYADTEVPLDDGQYMLSPKLTARLVQALQIERDEVVLEIGTGSGYLTTLLAELARHVVSIERSEVLHKRAAALLKANGVENLTMHCADGAAGWPDEAPYDVIVITAALGNLSRAPLDQLRVGGRLFAVSGQAPAMEATLITRKADNDWVYESLFETVIPPLVGGEVKEAFVL